MHKPMEQNKELRSKPIHLQPTDFQQRCQEHVLGEKYRLFNKWFWESHIFTCRRMKLDLYQPVQKLTQNELNTL
jgi:hypothetical protein